ncbi:pectin lyase fold/virulence factor [Leptodontidium sp. 2 PMI_412]|nr:pectin lyase fold/virulence factor [Leptodontidium sp. 2 PMI_412]
MKFINMISATLSLLGFSKAATIPTAELVKRTARTSTPSGCKTVRGSGTLSGEYSTLTAALASLSTSSTDAACIFIYGGTYNEGVYINYKGPLTLYGYTSDTGYQKYNVVNIQRSMTSTAAGNLDGSSTANIVSANFKAYNINFANTYGAGTQAVAVTANADQVGFYACGFYGYQDTLYAKSGKQYYSNCYIEGAVDYAFGDASAWFGECTFASNGGGAITATSRSDATDSHWYVIDHSTVTSKSGVSLTGKVYLGRPWRAYSRVIYQNSVLTDVVNAKGWTTLWAGATPIYEEYNNSGDGSDTSDRLYLTAATGPVSKDTLYGSGWKDWIDTSY